MTNVGGILRNDPIEFRNLAEVFAVLSESFISMSSTQLPGVSTS